MATYTNSRANRRPLRPSNVQNTAASASGTGPIDLPDIRYMNTLCWCQEMADVKITEKQNANKGKLYYVCSKPQHERCGFWEWCHPISSTRFGQSSTLFASQAQDLPIDQSMGDRINLVDEVEELKSKIGDLASTVRVIQTSNALVKLLAMSTLVMTILCFVLTVSVLLRT